MPELEQIFAGLPAFLSSVPVANGAAAAVLLAAALFLPLLLRPLAGKLDRPRTRMVSRLITALKNPVRAVLALVGMLLLAEGIDAVSGGGSAWLKKAWLITTIIIAAWVGQKIIGVIAERLVAGFQLGVKDNLQARRIHTQVRVLRRLASAILVVVAVALILMTFDEIRALGVSLIASAGVAGIIVGLAAQKTLGNFFTGLQIAITQPIRLEDAVVVEGEWGWIEEISLTYVVVRIWDLRRLILPISYFVDKPFENWTRKSADILGTVTLYLDYAMPLQPIREELDSILADTDKWDGRSKAVQVVDTSERAMKVRVLVSAHDAPSAWELRCLVRERLIAFLQKNYPDCLPRVRTQVAGAADVEAEPETAAAAAEGPVQGD